MINNFFSLKSLIETEGAAEREKETEREGGRGRESEIPTEVNSSHIYQHKLLNPVHA